MDLRLVIIDDNEVFLTAVRNLLEGEGMSVLAVATNAAAGLALVEAERPDLVVVDIHLGPDDGFDVAERIAALPDPPPVVLTSSHAATDLGDVLERSSAVAFLTKSRLSAGALGQCYRRSR